MSKSSESGIKAIIFDFGDVICFWDDSVLGVERSQSHGLPADAIREAVFAYQRQGGEGKYHSIQDFLDRSDHQTPVRRDVAHQVFEEWEASGQCDPRMVGLITRLKADYKIGLLSNYTKGLEEALLEKYKIHHLFDAVVSSYTIQRRKPHVDAYRYVLKELGVQPNEALFVDDKERNIMAARDIGMQGIVFQGFDDLKRQLDKQLRMIRG